jgi:ubiquinone/menaquinone biosynthesis C-methylase UbiE
MLSVQDLLPILVCPGSHASLRYDGTSLVTQDGAQQFPIDEQGILLFVNHTVSEDAERQRTHYDSVAAAYVTNLGYPHTQEYLAYLDNCLIKMIGDKALGTMAELCCGNGEAAELLKGRYQRLVGVDISAAMLRAAAKRHKDKPCGLLQADVTNLPLADATLDSVVILGGIHHVPDRIGLYSEVYRVLRPGGFFFWREPINDFFLWRWLRAIVYRLSPSLDHRTEAPLHLKDTSADLSRAGLQLAEWRPVGFIGFCLFMNSDIMVLNRLFRFVPGIRAITRAVARADDFLLRLRPLRFFGLLAIGHAVRPAD